MIAKDFNKLIKKVDYEYKFKYVNVGSDNDDDTLPILPDGCMLNESDLYVLPNGKLLPPGIYRDGNYDLLYEPFELSGFNPVIDPSISDDE